MDLCYIFLFCFKGNPFIIDDCISIIATPGHTGSDVSVVARNVINYGTVVIAGKLFGSHIVLL